MEIHIRDAGVEARLRRQIEITGSADAEEVLLRLIEAKEEHDLWLRENGVEIGNKIRRGIEQLDRGEGIPEDDLDEYLAKLKNQSD